MGVEIIFGKPTAIVVFRIPDVQFSLALALTAVIVGIVAFVLLLLRAVAE